MVKTILACVVSVFVVGAATATAAKLITSGDIKDGTIKSADIKNGTIKHDDIKKSTITRDRLANRRGSQPLRRGEDRRDPPESARELRADKGRAKATRATLAQVFLLATGVL